MEPDPGAFVGRLLAALGDYDETEAERILDEVLEPFGLDEAVALVMMPFLVDVGDRWESGAVSVTQEHFASHLVRSPTHGRRGGCDAHRRTARPWSWRVLPGERHDIAPLRSAS